MRFSTTAVFWERYSSSLARTVSSLSVMDLR
jgi:hypothetical protein